MKHFSVVAVVTAAFFLVAAFAFPAPSAAKRGIGVSISLNAAKMYQEALRIQNLWWQPGQTAIHLYRGILVQDDSCGCGASDHDTIFEKIYGNIVLEKELDIRAPLPKRAQLVFVGRELADNSANLEFTVNGKVIVVRPSRLSLPDARQYEGEYMFPLGISKIKGRAKNAPLRVDREGPWAGWAWSRWHYVEIPAAYLKSGKNIILIRSRSGKPGWAMMVADYKNFYKGSAGPPRFPKTSAKSEDGGKTWSQHDLGYEGKLSGEYVLRVFLDSYHPSGLLLSPVVDIAGEYGFSFKTLRTVRDVRVRIKSLPASSTSLVLEVRTGDSRFYDAKHWSAWERPSSGGKVQDIRGRYLQWRIRFSTPNPEESPELAGVGVSAEAEPWTGHFGRVKIIGEHNFTLGASPPGYAYENYDSAYLRNFRRTFKLDEVVAGARTEWERQMRLLYWAYRVPLKNTLPIYPWNPQNWIRAQWLPNGNMVMDPNEHQRRDKMCLFSNVVLMAALQSFGYAARHVNLNTQGMTGHEICEVWSDRFGKWVFLDATRGDYWYDKKTGTPVDTLQIHKVLESRWKRPSTWRRPFLFTQGPITDIQDLPIAVGGPHPPYRRHGEIEVFNIGGHLRIIPRNNMFSDPSPLPVSQGQEVWCWNGYLNWADPMAPPTEQFSDYTNREKDFNWPLNQVRFVAEETSTPGLASVRLNNNMPYLAAYLASIDGKGWKKVENHFQWKLHPGRNRLEVKGQNIAGVVGMAGSLVLEYQP